MHAVVDANYELPIACYVTTACSNDSRNLLPLLNQARARFEWFGPASVSADKGYDAITNYETIVADYSAVPIIAIREPGKRRSHRPPVQFDENYFPVCRCGQPMRESIDRFNKSRIYRCNRAFCNLYANGIKGCGQEVSIKVSDNYRLFCEIPRWSKGWSDLYSKRTEVERMFGRLKEHRRLENHCYRGLSNVKLHCLLSTIALQAKALAQLAAGGELRDCVRKVA